MCSLIDQVNMSSKNDKWKTFYAHVSLLNGQTLAL